MRSIFAACLITPATRCEGPASSRRCASISELVLRRLSGATAASVAVATMSVLLDGRFRFDNYVVGASNRLAVAAGRAVAESPGATYNPLFIYSPSGLGKTHLIGAIGFAAKQLQPELIVEYVAAR